MFSSFKKSLLLLQIVCRGIHFVFTSDLIYQVTSQSCVQMALDFVRVDFPVVQMALDLVRVEIVSVTNGFGSRPCRNCQWYKWLWTLFVSFTNFVMNALDFVRIAHCLFFQFVVMFCLHLFYDFVICIYSSFITLYLLFSFQNVFFKLFFVSSVNTVIILIHIFLIFIFFVFFHVSLFHFKFLLR